jgi:hypothetical protein
MNSTISKLKVTGVLCPVCRKPMTYLSTQFTYQDTFLGYTKRAWCNDCVGPFEQRSWTLLYSLRRQFITIIPGTDWFLNSAGNRVHIHDSDEIPF